MQMNCGDQAYHFSLPLRVMRMFRIPSTALFGLETNNCYIYADWFMVSNASCTNSARRAKKVLLLCRVNYLFSYWKVLSGRWTEALPHRGVRNAKLNPHAFLIWILSWYESLTPLFSYFHPVREKCGDWNITSNFTCFAWVWNLVRVTKGRVRSRVCEDRLLRSKYEPQG
jgi:hypothetical protein